MVRVPGGGDEPWHVGDAGRRLGRERQEPVQRPGRPRPDPLVGADQMRAPQRASGRRGRAVRRVSGVNLHGEAGVKQDDRGAEAADTGPDHEDIGARGRHTRTVPDGASGALGPITRGQAHMAGIC